MQNLLPRMQSKMKIDNDNFAEDKDKSSDSHKLASNSRLCSIPDSEFWSLATIVDELTISLLDTKAVFCMINSNKGFSDAKWVEEANRCNNGNGVLRRLYEQQAIYKMYRMPIYRPPPVFVVYLKHLDYRLKQELSKLDKWSKDYVMKEAIGNIFEHIDRRFYYLSAKPLLDWRLEN